MGATHLTAAVTKELERPPYRELPEHMTVDRWRHELAASGAGGVARNLVFVARLALYQLSRRKTPYPVPPDIATGEVAFLERCADRVIAALAEKEAEAA